MIKGNPPSRQLQRGDSFERKRPIANLHLTKLRDAA